MSSNETNDFMAFIKRYSVPVAAIIYILAFAVQLKEYTDKLGWRVLSIIVLVISVVWTVYVWTAKRITIIEPASLLPKFGKRVRVASALSVVLALIPVWFSLQPARPFSIPGLAIKLVNQKDTNVEISRTGEFFVAAPETPMVDAIVATGKIRLHQVGGKAPSGETLNVPAKRELLVLAEFLNPGKFRRLLDGGDLSFRIVIQQTDGQMLTKDGVPFNAGQLNEGYIELYTR